MEINPAKRQLANNPLATRGAASAAANSNTINTLSANKIHRLTDHPLWASTAVFLTKRIAGNSNVLGCLRPSKWKNTGASAAMEPSNSETWRKLIEPADPFKTDSFD
jgi:hypothetical protein